MRSAEDHSGTVKLSAAMCYMNRCFENRVR